MRSRTRRSGDVRGERAKHESTLARFVSEIRGQSEGDRSRRVARLWDGEFSLDSALAAVVFLPKRKSAVDVAKQHSMSPERVREYTRDGDFASYYERPDEEMLALWRTGVEETRNIIANDWA